MGAGCGHIGFMVPYSRAYGAMPLCNILLHSRILELEARELFVFESKTIQAPCDTCTNN